MEASRRAAPGTECDTARLRASLALDGELDDLGGRQLRAHLESCAECVRFVEEMNGMSTALRSAPLVSFTCRPTGGQMLRTCSSGRGRHWAGVGVAVMALVLVTGSLPGVHAGSRDSRVTERASSSGVLVSPLELPIGQRSAMDDFAAPPGALPSELTG